MRKAALLFVLVATSAFAGEILLGTLVVTDAGSVTNRTVGNINSGAGQFVVAPLSKITVQCDQAGLVLTDVAGCDAGNCIRVAADEKFATSINTSKKLSARAWNWDGGAQGSAEPVVTYTGGWIAAAAPAGQAVLYCRVYSRTGTE